MNQKEQIIQKAKAMWKQKMGFETGKDMLSQSDQRTIELMADFLLKMQGEHQPEPVLDAEEYYYNGCEKYYPVEDFPLHDEKDYHIENAFKFAEAYHRQASASLKARIEELKEAARHLCHLHACEQEGMLSGQPTPQEWYMAVNELYEAVYKE